EKLRSERRRKHEVVRQKWEPKYQSARKQIEAVRALIDRGDDMAKVLLADAMLTRLESHTDTLDSIARDATRLLGSLEGLVKEAREIIMLTAAAPPERS